MYAFPAGEDLPMLFRLVNSEFDSHTERGYVELRANEGSFSDTTARIGDVRFPLRSGHAPSQHQCLQSAS
jgi:hypothetical protein